MKDLLTAEQLTDMKPGVFAKGEIENSQNGIYMTHNDVGRKLKWVAVRGGIPDWKIYVLWADNDFETVRTNGDKIYARLGS